MSKVDSDLGNRVRHWARTIARSRPGKAIELRIPPYAAVQLGAPDSTTIHRRGTPPTLVEMDPDVFLSLVAGTLTWEGALSSHLLQASGIRSDLGDLFWPPPGVQDLTQKIADRRIVGISGPDCSGKTTLSRNLKRYIHEQGGKAVVIHVDDFHNPASLRRQGANDIEAYYDKAFNYDQLVGEVLAPLRDHGEVAVTLTCLDLLSDTYSRTMSVEVSDDSLVIVEGVLLLRPPLIDYFDTTIWIDISHEEVLRRAEIRDVPIYGPEILGKYREKYLPVLDRFIEEYHPIESAEIVLSPFID